MATCLNSQNAVAIRDEGVDMLSEKIASCRTGFDPSSKQAEIITYGEGDARRIVFHHERTQALNLAGLADGAVSNPLVSGSGS